MSFTEDFALHGEVLIRLVDAGEAVKSVALVLGISADRVYAMLRGCGRGSGRSKTVITNDHRKAVQAVFADSGSVNLAAKTVGLNHSTARGILVAAGLVSAQRISVSKPVAKQRFQELLAAGWSAGRAAREVGVHPRTGRDWSRGIRKVGNTRIHPDGTVVDYRTGTSYTKAMSASRTLAPPAINNRYLSAQNRLDISDGLIARLSLTAIAAGIGKNKSTVSREIRAHSVAGVYLPHRAHQRAAASRRRPKQSKLHRNEKLREQVKYGLERKLSPEQISHRLVKDFPDEDSMRVSHETIYQALYFQARGGLKREVQQALRTGRTRRKPHRQPDQRTHRFVDEMIMIADRPAEVEDRAVPGHWEGDLITGEYNRTAIGTLVERTTRYTMLVHLPHGHNAEQVRDALIKSMLTLPAHLRGSLTWDQGAEMARHKAFALATDMQVYFCDPASPWQRGTNENTNGLLRQYFPKSTDLSIHGPEDLEHVAQELNSRPRKTLDWETPAERLRKLLNS